MHVTNEYIMHLLSLTNPVIINERIVADMIMQIKSSKEGLLEFSELFEQLVDPASKVHIEMFRDGMYVCTQLASYGTCSWPVT